MNSFLQTAQPRQRETIVNRSTRYAVECVIDGHITVIAFQMRQSKMNLIRAAREQKDAILPFLADDDTCSYRAGVLVLGSRVTLRYGATERQS